MKVAVVGPESGIPKVVHAFPAGEPIDLLYPESVSDAAAAVLADRRTYDWVLLREWPETSWEVAALRVLLAGENFPPVGMLSGKNPESGVEIICTVAGGHDRPFAVIGAFSRGVRILRSGKAVGCVIEYHREPSNPVAELHISDDDLL